jgi:hypothetical protein
MGKAEREKGKRGELDVASYLKEVFPAVRRKLDQYQATSGVDLENTNPLYFQIKNMGRPNSAIPVLKEVEPEARAEGGLPVAAIKGGRTPWTVTMYLSDFVKLLQCIKVSNPDWGIDG